MCAFSFSIDETIGEAVNYADQRWFRDFFGKAQGCPRNTHAICLEKSSMIAAYDAVVDANWLKEPSRQFQGDAGNALSSPHEEKADAISQLRSSADECTTQGGEIDLGLPCIETESVSAGSAGNLFFVLF